MNANLRAALAPSEALSANRADWAAQALELHPVAHTLLAADGTVRWLNLASALLLNQPPANVVGKSWVQIKPCYAGKLDLHNTTAGPTHTWRQPDGRVGHFKPQLQRLANGDYLLIETDVTEVIGEQQGSSRRDQLLRHLTDSSPDSILVVDAAGIILRHSAAFSDLLGHAADLVNQHHALEFVHPDDLHALRERLATGAHVYSPGRFEESICRILHADGSWRWVALTIVNSLTVPSVEAVLIYLRDATRQVQLERELRHRVRRSAALTENCDDMIVVLGNDGLLSFESGSISRFLGFRPRELNAARLLGLLHPTSRRSALRIIRDLMINGSSGEQTVESLIRSHDGQYRWIEAVCVNLMDDPDVAGILINARDITARKSAELERDTAVVCGGIALWESDDGYRSTRWIGAGMPDLFSTQNGRVSDDSFYGRMHPDDRKVVRQTYESARRGLVREVQVKFRTRDKQGRWRWILERGQYAGVNPVTGAKRVLGACIDITQQRTIEEQLLAAHDKLRIAIDASQMSFYDWNVSNDTVAGLDEWCVRHGLPTEGDTGADARWDSYIHPDDLPEVQRLFAAHLRGESEYADLEYRLRCGDGRLVWLMDRARVVERDSKQKPLRVIGLLVDIDKRKRVEQALLASEVRLSTAIWGGSFGLWEMDVNTMRTRWLSDWCEREDFDPCETDHVNSWDSHIHPEDLPAAAAAFTRMTNNEVDSFESEYRVQTRNGEWKWILERSRATARDGNGQPIKVAGICINIDNRKKAEEALRKSEARYRSVVELSPGFVAELSINDSGQLHQTWVSEGFTEVFGVPFSRLAGMRGSQQLYADSNEWHRVRKLQGQVATGVQVDFEVQVRRVDGSLRWLYVITRPMPDSSGRFTSAISVAHDITQRKHAENALHEAQRDMQLIAKNSPDWLFLLDANGKVQYANRGTSNCSVADMLGNTLQDLSLAQCETKSEIARIVASTLAGHEESFSETVSAGSVKGARYVMHRTRPIMQGSQPVGALVISSDVTQQQEQEQLLRLQARVLETIREGVVLLDTRNAVRLTNPAFDRMCGAQPGELLGSRIDSLFLTAVEKLQSPSEMLEFAVRRLDGSLFSAAAVVTPMEVNNQPHWLVVLNDVSERKLLEREIIEVSSLEQQRIGSDLHDGLGQELTGVALMLRALATRINREFPDVGAEVGEIVALVNHSIESTRAMARGLSPVSIERGGLLPALQTLVLRARSAYGITINLRRIIRRPLRLDADAATHLYRIVQEALTNAVRHGRATRIVITITSAAPHVEISIRDDGRGMTQQGPRGAGIGLKTMTYRAQMLGGELTIGPARGGGTVVRCRCPQKRQRGEVPASERKARLHVTRILVGS